MLGEGENGNHRTRVCNDRNSDGFVGAGKAVAGEQESFEEMVIGAITNEVRRRRGLAAHERIVARSAAVEAVSGVQSSSVELIRQLREGEGRSD